MGQPSRHGHKWNLDEDLFLISEVESDWSISKIAEKHSRTELAIDMRIEKLKGKRSKVIYLDKSKAWFSDFKLHAVIKADGTKYWYLNGLLHREDGPACEYINGTKLWYLNGLLHREDGPGMKLHVTKNGSKYYYLPSETECFVDGFGWVKGLLHRLDGPAVEWTCGFKAWYINGKRHREDGPAYEFAGGDKPWYINGKLHREDGPALEYGNGDKCWYINGKLHREDGPALEYGNGDKCWYINGKEYSKDEFKKITQYKAQVNKKVERKMSKTVEMLKNAITRAGEMKIYHLVNEQCIDLLKNTIKRFGVNVPDFLESEAGQIVLQGGAPLLVHWIAENYPDTFTWAIDKQGIDRLMRACALAFEAEVFLNFSKLVDTYMAKGIRESLNRLVTLGEGIEKLGVDDPESVIKFYQKQQSMSAQKADL